jgi:hypothetical protein
MGDVVSAQEGHAVELRCIVPLLAATCVGRSMRAKVRINALGDQ